jgi:hypothetical protein
MRCPAEVYRASAMLPDSLSPVFSVAQVLYFWHYMGKPIPHLSIQYIHESESE